VVDADDQVALGFWEGQFAQEAGIAGRVGAGRALPGG
jgi:hypothetical protein